MDLHFEDEEELADGIVDDDEDRGVECCSR